MPISCRKIFGSERVRKEISIILTAVLAIGLLGMLMDAAPVFAATWDPNLGWDFQCHSNTHPHLSQLTDAQIRAELQAVNDAFIAHGYAPPQHIAYPYGDYGKSATSQARVKGVVSEYRLSGRVVWGKMETYPIADWYVHKAAQLKRPTGWRKIQAWVDDAIATNALLHIFTHDIAPRPSSYGCTPEKLAMLLDYLKAKQDLGQLTVMTMAEAYDVWYTATSSPGPTVVVSFDDAHESDYLVAYQMFQARGLKGTSYIVTSFIDQPGSLTWAEIATMRAGLP